MDLSVAKGGHPGLEGKFGQPSYTVDVRGSLFGEKVPQVKKTTTSGPRGGRDFDRSW